MGNVGTLEITLLDVTGAPVHDPATRLIVRRGGTQDVIKTFRTSFPPARQFALPAFPTEHVLAPHIEPKRFRGKPLPPFTLTDAKTVTRNVTVFRRPSEWTHAFTEWASLGDRFDALKAVLEESPGVRVRGGPAFDRLTGPAYDEAHTNDRVVLPKACLLNLYCKLTELREPIRKQKPWFGFVKRLLEIGRERMIAVVDPEMAERVFELHDHIADHADVYKRAPVGDHHKNLPTVFGVVKSSMKSLKTVEDQGNLQLTIGRGTDRETGSVAWLLDADIDENGKLLAHLGDLFKHRFTGGTHPIDIHEYLRLSHPGADLGYSLE